MRLRSRTSRLRLIVEDGKLTMQDESSIDDTEIAWSLQVLQALRHRGIAYAFANLINWKAREKYLDSLFRFITKPAQAGYSFPEADFAS